MLAPEYEEVVTGDAEVREIFRVPRIGAIAGCYVQNGAITRGSKVRFLRDGTIIWKGTITSLKRFKEDAQEVRAGFECGIGLSDFQDLKPGDVIETFDERQIERNAEQLMAGASQRPSRPNTSRGGHAYPRSARVGETLREIIAEELVRIDDERARVRHRHGHRGRRRAQPGSRLLRLAGR